MERRTVVDDYRRRRPGMSPWWRAHPPPARTPSC